MKGPLVEASLRARVLAQRARRSLKLTLEKHRLWVALGWSAFPFVIHEAKGTGKLFKCRLGGEQLWVRAGTTDFVVAWANLCGDEFRPVPRNLSSKRPTLIIDAGAYIGSSSLALARVFPGVRVLALEPHPANFEVLELNVASSRAVTPINAALTDSVGTAQLRDQGQGEYGYSIVSDSTSCEQEWSVPTVSISSLLEEFDAERVLILKLDIEGAEVQVLEAGSSSLTQVDCVVAELHDFLDSRCTDTFLAAIAEMRLLTLGSEKAIAVRAEALDAAAHRGN